MRRVLKISSMLAILIMLLMVFVSTTMSVVGVDTSGSGTVTVPKWEKGDNWGYKVPEYMYSSTYIGIGFEVLGTKDINGYECYEVKIWWDSEYGTEDSNEFDFEIPGYSSTFRYVGYAYFTTEDLAVARFSMELDMRMQMDGSKASSMFTRQDFSEGDMSDFTEIIDMMKDWKYDISYSMSMDYNYDPPFMMYDFPLEVGKKWNSTSTVSVSWEYSTDVWMNDAMKKDIGDLYAGDTSEMEFSEEEGSDSMEFTLTGSFEVLRQETVTTETGDHEVLVIQYDVSTITTRATTYPYETDEPPDSYGDMYVPAGDSTMQLVGCSDGSGKSYYDVTSGYPQKMESGGYFPETYSTVDPVTIENSYNDLSDSARLSDESDKETSAETNVLLLIAGVAVTLVVIFVVLIVVFKKKMNQQPQQPYPNQNPHQNQQQQPYQSYPNQNQYGQGPTTPAPQSQYPENSAYPERPYPESPQQQPQPQTQQQEPPRY
jgi:hypothetical protein